MAIVYKITCITTGKIYFGWTAHSLKARFRKHCRNRQRRCYLAACMNKHGAENFVVEQVAAFRTNEEAIAKEIELIAAWRTNIRRYPDNNGMNMTDGGEGSTGYAHDNRTKERIKQSSTGRKHSEETRKLISRNSKEIRYPRTAEHAAKISEGLKRAYASGARKPRCCQHSPETKEKMSVAHKGKRKSLETRKRMSLARKGRIVSQDTREKLRVAATGRKQSPETIEKRVSKFRGRKLGPRSKTNRKETT